VAPRGTRKAASNHFRRGTETETGADGELAREVAHHLSSIIGALSLRVAVLSSDPACRKAQGSNIDALLRLLEEGRALVSSLQEMGHGRAPVRRSR
jgi:hypothetical protein